MFFLAFMNIIAGLRTPAMPQGLLSLPRMSPACSVVVVVVVVVVVDVVDVVAAVSFSVS